MAPQVGPRLEPYTLSRPPMFLGLGFRVWGLIFLCSSRNQSPALTKEYSEEWTPKLFKGGYIRDHIADYSGGYDGGYLEFRLRLR